MRGPQEFVRHLQEHQYHPRSDSHSNAMCEAVLADLLEGCGPFSSPLRGPDDITHHDDIGRIGKETVELYRNLPLRNEPSDGPGMEAVCVIVVEHDNLAKHPGLPYNAPRPAPTRLVTRPPAPQPGDPLSYETFVHRLCRAYRERWA